MDLLEGYRKVLKRDIENGVTVYLRSDIAEGIIKPYKHNINGNVKIGLSEVKTKLKTYRKWVWCNDICKK